VSGRVQSIASSVFRRNRAGRTVRRRRVDIYGTRPELAPNDRFQLRDVHRRAAPRYRFHGSREQCNVCHLPRAGAGGLFQRRARRFAAETDTVLASLELEYERAIEADDDVTVALRVADLGTSSLPMAYEIRAGGSRAATASTVQVLVDSETESRDRSRPSGERESSSESSRRPSDLVSCNSVPTHPYCGSRPRRN